MVHVPVPKNELCSVNAKVGLGFTCDLFEHSNKDVIDFFFIHFKKSKLPFTINADNKLDLCILWKPSSIPGYVLNSSLSSSST